LTFSHASGRLPAGSAEPVRDHPLRAELAHDPPRRPAVKSSGIGWAFLSREDSDGADPKSKA
jgi:hypothetical protein